VQAEDQGAGRRAVVERGCDGPDQALHHDEAGDERGHADQPAGHPGQRADDGHQE